MTTFSDCLWENISSTFRGKAWVSFIHFGGHTVFREQNHLWIDAMEFFPGDAVEKCGNPLEMHNRHYFRSEEFADIQLQAFGKTYRLHRFWYLAYLGMAFSQERGRSGRNFHRREIRGRIGQGMRIHDANLLFSGIISLCARRGRTGQCSAHLWVISFLQSVYISGKKMPTLLEHFST